MTSVQKMDEPGDREAAKLSNQETSHTRAPTAGESHAPATEPMEDPSQSATTQEQAQAPDRASSGTLSVFSAGLSVDDNSDVDSSLGDVDRPQSSVSVISTVFNFVQEYGRTFHKYKQGKYPFPNDSQEQERLDLQHSIALMLFEKLALAPIDNPPRVLDIGTGTGVWAIEFATQNPASDVLGTDLSPIQPDYVPPNCRFEIDDAEDVWIFSQKLDYIHSRYMIAAIDDFEKLFRSSYENLNPGGWAEFQEYHIELRCVDGSLAGTALERWNKMILEGFKKMGRNGRAAAQFKSQMIRTGFVDVVECKFALPGSPWAKGERQKMLGWMQMANLLEGLHGVSMAIFTKSLGWTVEEVEVFLANVRKDIRNTGVHFYYIMYSVYGRKPPPGTSMP